MGYSNQIATDLTFELTVGASRVASLGRGGSGHNTNTSVRLEKTLEDESFSLYYTQTTGQPSGLGSTSDTRSAGIAMARAFSDASLVLNVSAFDARGTLDNPFDTRGVAAAATIGLALTETLSIQGGGQFQQFTQASEFGFTQKRVFVSLSYRDPDLWRFFR